MMSDNAIKPRLLVDIVTDPVCPWCFVGLKSWEKTRKKLSADFEVITRFRPYELNPGIAIEGTDRQAHYDRKFPDHEKRAEMMGHLIAAAENVGAPFDPTAPKWLPNTMKAHRVMRWAHLEGRHEALADRLYSAFWLEGANIGDDETLAKLAGDAGMDTDLVRQDLAGGKDDTIVEQEAQAFRDAGVRGVPTFIVAEKHGFSGALPPEDLEERMRYAINLEPAPLSQGPV